jgi:hypothetical protein
MQYMLLIYVQESLDAALPEDQLKAIYEGYRIFSRELAASGALRGGSELAAIATATTVRVRNGKVLTTDGPICCAGPVGTSRPPTPIVPRSHWYRTAASRPTCSIGSMKSRQPRELHHP